MARLLEFYCQTCGNTQEVLSFESEKSAESLAPTCCGLAMLWSPSIGLTIANPTRLTRRGTPVTSVGADYLDVCKKDREYAEKYSGTERWQARTERDEHDKAVKEGRKDKKIIVT